MNADPQTPRLVCDGLRVGDVFVPPFRVRAGELIKLQFAVEQSRQLDGVLKALSTGDSRGSVRAAGSVAVPQLALNRSTLLEVFHRQRAAEWLIRQTGMPRTEATARLERVGVSASAPLCALAGTPRWLLGLLAALCRHPSILVFQTVGLDPLGTTRALRSVKELLEGAGAVYLCSHDDVDLPDSEYTAVIAVNSISPASLV